MHPISYACLSTYCYGCIECLWAELGIDYNDINSACLSPKRVNYKQIHFEKNQEIPQLVPIKYESCASLSGASNSYEG